MKFYEIMYIINSSLEPGEITQVKSEIVSFLESEGADIYNKSDSGRTRLAYEIEKQRYGNYILLRFASKPELIRPVREKFGLMDAVLSSLVIVLDKEPERIEEEIIKKAEPDTFSAKDKKTSFVKAEDKGAKAADKSETTEAPAKDEKADEKTDEAADESTESDASEPEKAPAKDKAADEEKTEADGDSEAAGAVDESETTEAPAEDEAAAEEKTEAPDDSGKADDDTSEEEE